MCPSWDYHCTKCGEWITTRFVVDDCPFAILNPRWQAGHCFTCPNYENDRQPSHTLEGTETGCNYCVNGIGQNGPNGGKGDKNGERHAYIANRKGGKDGKDDAYIANSGNGANGAHGGLAGPEGPKLTDLSRERLNNLYPNPHAH